jgi:glycosyltransferase involved in cell wall biosynthesis
MSKGAKSNKATVLIVNWNGEQFLERCLTALLAQTVTPYEIILVDNASTDGSLEIARRFPSVRLLAQDSNTGFARGNNLAINTAAAGSEWIALLNPDAFPEPCWLEECLLSAQRNPQFDIFGSKLVNASVPLLLDGARYFLPVRRLHCIAAAHCSKSGVSMRTSSAMWKMSISVSVYGWPVIGASMCRNLWCIMSAPAPQADKTAISLSITGIAIWCGRS